MLVYGASVSRDNRRVVKELQKTTTMLGQNYLLLGALNGGSELGRICLLELLTSLTFCQ